jgi:hypothetical protein
MKRKQAAHSSTKKPRPRTASRLKQIEDRMALLLLLLQHNIDKMIQHKRSR